MAFPHKVIVLALLMTAPMMSAQAVPPAAQTPAVAPAPVPAVTASSLLQPSLTQTQTTLASLKLDKWKKGSVRDEAGDNVNALLRDLQTHLPPLLTAADAEPAALSRAIPLMKHLDAFYDVLLRVEEASRVSAPGDQVTSLQQTMLDVNKARIAYDDQLKTQAASQEKRVFDLQAELKTQKDAAAALQAKIDAVPATPPPCKPATAATHKKKRTTTGTTPSAGAPATPKPQ